MSIFKSISGLLVETNPDSNSESGQIPPPPQDIKAALAALDTQLKNGGVAPQAIQAAEQTATPPMVAADGTLDFDGVYRVAGILESAYDAEQALEMLSQLPETMPKEAKMGAIKQILDTINKMNTAAQVTPASIVSDSTQKINALTRYAEGIAGQVKKYCDTCDVEIQALEKKIEAIKNSKIEADKQNTLTQTVCQKQIANLKQVSEFFTPAPVFNKTV